jgi:hypothetical protein
VEHRAGSVDLLAAWPATAHPANHGQRRIIASTATSRDLLPAAQSRVQEHRRVFMAVLLLLPLLPLLSASDRSHCKSLRLAVHREQAENKLLGGTPLAGVWTLLHTGAVLTPEGRGGGWGRGLGTRDGWPVGGRWVASGGHQALQIHVLHSS